MVLRPPGLHILTWNAGGGIKSKTPELLLYMRQHDIHLALLQETWLAPQVSWKVANHKVYREDRVVAPGIRQSGGTAILISTQVDHFQIPIPPLISLEAVGVQVHTPGGHLRLISVYKRPTTRLNVADIDILLASPIPTVLMGDFNSKHPSWNSLTANTAGNALRDHADRSTYVVAGPVDPTHFPLGGAVGRPDVLDIALLANIRCSYNLEAYPALSSDHNPVVLNLGDRLLLSPPCQRPDFHKADWDAFRAHLDAGLPEDPPPLTSTVDVDAAVESITTLIQEAIATSTPTSSRGRITLYDLPEGLRRSVTFKNRLRRTWQRTHSAHDKTAYNRASTALKRDIAAFRSELWDTTVAGLDVSGKSYWRMARALQRIPQADPPIQGPQILACSSVEKANVLADSLEAAFTLNPPTASTPQVEEQVLQWSQTHHVPLPLPDDAGCTFEELLQIAKDLPHNKAPGDDGITAQVILQLSMRAANTIHAIFNAVLELQHFPSSWKTAKVITFLKPGKSARDPTSYRPISLLSVLSKMLERVILVRLQRHIDDTNLLPDEQFGFRAKHSTIQQLTRITDKITDGWNGGCASAAVFLDVSKAFDRVWHVGLIHKLVHFQFPDYLILLIQSFLIERTFYVSKNSVSSSRRPILAGVPQGSVLSPALFNVFTADMPPPPEGVTSAMFADDFVALSTNRRPWIAVRVGQRYLDTISDWYANSRMALNVDKTSSTLFSWSRKRPPPRLRLNDVAIPWAPTNRCLGIILDRKLTWGPHIRSATQKATGKLVSLYPLLRNAQLSVTAKLRLYTSVIRSAALYASPVWGGCAASHRNRLQVVQNKILRVSLSLPRWTRMSEVHADLGLQTVDQCIAAQAARFYASLEAVPNPQVSALAHIIPRRSDVFPRPIAALGPRFLPPRRQARLLRARQRLIAGRRRVGVVDPRLRPP